MGPTAVLRICALSWVTLPRPRPLLCAGHCWILGVPPACQGLTVCRDSRGSDTQRCPGTSSIRATWPPSPYLLNQKLWSMAWQAVLSSPLGGSQRTFTSENHWTRVWREEKKYILITTMPQSGYLCLQLMPTEL